MYKHAITVFLVSEEYGYEEVEATTLGYNPFQVINRFNASLAETRTMKIYAVICTNLHNGHNVTIVNGIDE
jgi:hypothetical protein